MFSSIFCFSVKLPSLCLRSFRITFCRDQLQKGDCCSLCIFPQTISSQLSPRTAEVVPAIHYEHFPEVCLWPHGSVNFLERPQRVTKVLSLVLPNWDVVGWSLQISYRIEERKGGGTEGGKVGRKEKRKEKRGRTEPLPDWRVLRAHQSIRASLNELNLILPFPSCSRLLPRNFHLFLHVPRHVPRLPWESLTATWAPLPLHCQGRGPGQPCVRACNVTRTGQRGLL